MWIFDSCQTHFKFLSQFREVLNVFECFLTQVQTHFPKTKWVWHMKILCDLYCTCIITLLPCPYSDFFFINTLRRNSKKSSFSRDFFDIIAYTVLVQICWIKLCDLESSWSMFIYVMKGTIAVCLLSFISAMCFNGSAVTRLIDRKPTKTQLNNY